MALNFQEVQKNLGWHPLETEPIRRTRLDGSRTIIDLELALMVSRSQGKEEGDTVLGIQSRKTRHFGIGFDFMERAIFSGDGQIELFTSMDVLVNNVEYWLLEQTPCRAFLEDGTEYELFIAEGAHINRPLSAKAYWVADFRHTSARPLSEVGAKRDELTRILKSGLSKSNRLSEVEQKIDYSLEHALQLFVERLGYST
ncbi:hypothetical protein [Sphingorhabdus sp.]|uniref:hypothetical protein n=1 Tax=Sphingorhabdus sp. TaxID=1902408 RepID=UPI003594903A